jgi:hypothetical protein
MERLLEERKLYINVFVVEIQMKLNLNIDLEIAKSMENLAHTKIKVI